MIGIEQGSDDDGGPEDGAVLLLRASPSSANRPSCWAKWSSPCWPATLNRLGKVEFRKVLPYNFLFRVSLDRLSAGIPRDHAAFRIEDKDGIFLDAIHQQAKKFHRRVPLAPSPPVFRAIWMADPKVIFRPKACPFTKRLSQLAFVPLYRQYSESCRRPFLSCYRKCLVGGPYVNLTVASESSDLVEALPWRRIRRAEMGISLYSESPRSKF